VFQCYRIGDITNILLINKNVVLTLTNLDDAPVLGHNVLQLPCQLSEQVVEPAAEVRKEKAALTVDKQR